MFDMSPKLPDNKLCESHRIILPEMREKSVHTCKDCRFFTEIEGQEENRWGCVVGVPIYRSLERRVPAKITARRLLEMVGKEKLRQIVSQSNSEAQACGWFRNRL